MSNSQSSPFPLPPSAFPLSPSPFRRRSRRGISLLEVLISIGVLAVGLLGVLAIIPLGQMTLAEAVKADRAGACGRAAMRNIKVQRMLDYRAWPSPSTNVVPTWAYVQPFVVDPMGTNSTDNLPQAMTERIPNSAWLIRVNLLGTGAVPLTQAVARSLFVSPDDIGFDVPANTIDRPRIPPATPPLTLNELRSLDYSWLFTVTPASSEVLLPYGQRRLFNVTVALFYKRDLRLDPSGYPTGEWMARLRDQGDLGFPGMGVGGGTITLDHTNIMRVKAGVSAASDPQTSLLTAIPGIRENQWVMLWDGDNNQCHWYRVVGVNLPDSPSNNDPATLTLDGPDWVPTATTRLIVIEGAIGAYTSTVELDCDPLWGGM